MQTPGTTGVSAAAHVPKKGPHHISDSVSVSWVGDLEAGCVGTAGPDSAARARPAP